MEERACSPPTQFWQWQEPAKTRTSAGECGSKSETKAQRPVRQDRQHHRQVPSMGTYQHTPLKRVGRSGTTTEAPDPKIRMEGENGKPQIKRNGNPAGRTHKGFRCTVSNTGISYHSQGRIRNGMAIGVTLPMINGP